MSTERVKVRPTKSHTSNQTGQPGRDYGHFLLQLIAGIPIHVTPLNYTRARLQHSRMQKQNYFMDRMNGFHLGNIFWRKWKSTISVCLHLASLQENILILDCYTFLKWYRIKVIRIICLIWVSVQFGN